MSYLTRSMEYKYDHFGLPVKEKREGMLYFPKYKVWYADYKKDPYRIEWLYFEKESGMHPLIQNVSHVCFLVKDIQQAVYGKKLLIKPTQDQNYWMAFIEESGIPVEFIQAI